MSYRDLYFSSSPRVSNKIPGKKPIICLFGAPFDSTSTYRAGSRFAPNAIREAFLNIEVYFPELGVDVEKIPLDDLGNIAHCALVEEQVTMIKRVVSELVAEGFVPGVLGGEHTITLPINEALPKKTGLIVFDAHFDLRSEYSGLKLSHATFLKRLLDKKRGLEVIHIGGRAATSDEWRKARKAGFTLITPEKAKTNGVSELNRAVKGLDSIHVTLDLDVLDPAYAPGVGNPEPGGISSADLLHMLMALRGEKIRAFDIVELSPPYDNGVTAAVAAKALAVFCALIGGK